MSDLISQYIKFNHFGNFLGMEFEILSEGEIRYTLKITEKQLATPKHVHGGCISALADACLGVGALSAVASRGQVVSTLEFKISYFDSVENNQKLIAISRVKKLGKTIVFMEVDIRNEKKDVIAHATGTFKAYDAKKAGYTIN